MFVEPRGKVATVFNDKGQVVYPAEERSVCIVRNHRSNTTVNGVCLECQTSNKEVRKKK